MRLRVRDIENRSILAGADTGKRLFSRAAEKLSSPSKPEILFVDFEGVELASASFLREAVLGLKGWCRRQGSKWFPVVANAGSDTLNELSIVCDLQSDAILACNLDSENAVTCSTLIGQLDEKQHDAFQFVTRSRGATAKELMESSTSERALSPTAWNNRLNVLVQKGLVMESSAGRSKIFRPLLEEAENGY